VPTIEYVAENFPAAYGAPLAGEHALTTSIPALVWAAISVGKRQLGHLTLHGLYSLFEMIYRAAIIFANLREGPDGTILRSSAYRGLDPSEKGAISYFIGLTLAKLFAHDLLGVPWLMHLDVYRQQLQPVLVGNEKPDLVGLNANNDWVVVEAKGRTNDYSETALVKAKSQSQQLATIQGKQPVLRVGALAYFKANRLRFAMRDPKRDRHARKLLDLPLTKEMLLIDYYRPFRVWLRERRAVDPTTIDGHLYRVASLPEFDMAVGLSEEWTDAPPILSDAAKSRPLSSNEFVGKDGIFVSLGPSWSRENMRLEPQERHRRDKA
jgi:hypothetical protein